jgi:hypothetical protein
MEVLRIEKSKGWPEILKLMPVTTQDTPLIIALEFEGGVRQAISRKLKRSNPEMKFETKIVFEPELGYEVLSVWKQLIKKTA